MNIWGLFLILVFILQGFYEYLLLIIRKFKKIKKDYEKLLKMRKNLENMFIDSKNDKNKKN